MIATSSQNTLFFFFFKNLNSVTFVLSNQKCVFKKNQEIWNMNMTLNSNQNGKNRFTRTRNR